jgi:hypothetical protein
VSTAHHLVHGKQQQAAVADFNGGAIVASWNCDFGGGRGKQTGKLRIELVFSHW